MPIAARPATPAPMMKTLAGGTLPAAVIWPVKKRPKCVRRLDDRAVAGDVGHRGQRVHLLRAAEMRGTLSMASTVDLARRELLHQLGVLRRPDEADQRLALAHQVDFVGARRAHLEDDVGAAQSAGRVGDDLGAGGAVGVVAEVRRLAGAGSTATLKPSLMSFSTTSGTVATRFSPGAVSRGTPMTCGMRYSLIGGPGMIPRFGLT